MSEPVPEGRTATRGTARAARLQVQLHGAACVHVPQGKPLPLRGRAAALLALVALEPGISRERVAALLWPDAPGPRQNLRQQLLRFRQALGQALLEGEERLHLAPGVQLQEPVSGAPLLGDELAGDDEFGHWLAQQRQAQQRRQSDPVLSALAEAEQAGDFGAALRHAQALLALAPQEEAHHTAVMRLHYLRGEPAAGLVQYQRLQSMLRAALGAAPSAASEALAQALRRARAEEAAPPAAPAVQQAGRGVTTAGLALPVTLRRPPVLVGRASERQAVLDALAQGRAVLLQGEAGLGKSRLIADLAGAWGALPPQAALAAAGRPADAGAPYTTLARLLQPLLQAAVAAADEATAGAAALAFLAPQPTRVRPDTGYALHPGELQDAVADLLRARGVRSVVLDDLHFADDATLDLVAGLAAADPEPGRPPCRWLFAQRPTEVGTAARALQAALVEARRLAVVELTPLTEDATAQLIDTLGVDGLRATELAPPLVRHTGGNPLFVLETLKQGLADGSLARGLLPRPASVDALIAQRLARLSPPALALARVAAIAGVDFGIELAEAAIGHSAVQLASAWSELQAAQVLRDEAFAHDLVSDAVLQGVPRVVARRVHAQCAQWLAAHGGEPARVARHWLQGGQPAQAGQAFVAAALRASAASRSPEEALLYLSAAQAFEAAGMADERFTALCNHVGALCGTDLGDATLAHAQALLAQAGSDSETLRAQHVLVGLLDQRGERAQAVPVGEAALALALRMGDLGMAISVACPLACALRHLGRAQAAYGVLLPLREHAQGCGDPARSMLWHGEWAATLGHLGRQREAVLAYEPAFQAARALGRRDAHARLVMNQSVTLRELGLLDRARITSSEGCAMTRADCTGGADHDIAALVAARDEIECGRFAPALTEVEALVVRFEAGGMAVWALAARLLLAQAWMHLGQGARAPALLADEPGGTPAWLGATRRLLRVELALLRGQLTPVGVCDEAMALATTDATREIALRARAARALPAAQVLAQAPAWADALASRERFGALLALHVHVARAALFEQRTAQAAAAARAALALFEQGYAPDAMYRAEAWLVAWRALAAAGAHEEARRALLCGADWVRQQALPHVPATFIDSFLHRNPVNRDLLAAAAVA